MFGIETLAALVIAFGGQVGVDGLGEAKGQVDQRKLDEETQAGAKAKECANWQAPGDGSMGMALVDGELWVGDRKEGKAFALGVKDGRVVRSLKLPCRELGGLAGAEGKLWCTEVIQGLIFAVDAKTGRTLERMEAPCDYPGAATWLNGRLWIHCPFHRKISVTDPADGTTVKWVPAPSKRVSALGSGGGFTFAADREKDQLFFMDPESGAVLATLPVDSPFPTGVASDGRMLYVADYQADRVSVIDLDALPPFVVESSKTERVTFKHIVLSGGPAPLQDLEVFVALPEDRETQKILSLNPFPQNALPEEVKDNQGQRFWKFRVDELPAGQEVSFGFVADVEVRQVRWFTDPRRKAGAGDIPRDIRKRYLVDATKYMIHDPLVVKAAKEIAGEEKNLHLLFQRTYRYVLDHMEYDLSGGWNAAPLLLERGSGSCSEYTILLIALLRAVGIPARYVGSVVMRGEPASVDLVAHRWAEVYLPGLGWLPADAQRGDVEWPAKQAEGFGFLEGVFLITTVGGGDSDILGWGYNSVARFRHDGPAEAREWTSAEWEPIDSPSAPLPKR